MSQHCESKELISYCDLSSNAGVKKKRKETQFNQEQRVKTKKRGKTEEKKALERLLCVSGEVL